MSDAAGPRHLRTWYAIALCVWATPTLLAAALFVGIGAIGPSSDPRPHPAWPRRYGWLIAWAALPVIGLPWGIGRSRRS